MITTFEQYDLIDASGLFDAQYYLDKNPDVAKAGLDPLRHYLDVGASIGLNPSAVFDVALYMELCARQGLSPQNPLLHYLLEGRALGIGFEVSGSSQSKTPQKKKRGKLAERKVGEGRSERYSKARRSPGARTNSGLASVSVGLHRPSSDDPDRVKLQRILESRLFDAAYYAAAYGLGFDSDQAALEHFFFSGYIEGKRPNPYFDPLWYLEKNPEVRAAGTQPLFHYLSEGEAAGCQPSLIFNPTWYRSTYDVPADEVALVHYLDRRTSYRFSPLPEFDVEYYGNANPDVKAAGVDPVDHFLYGGFREGRNPSPKFNVEIYAELFLNGNLESNPFLHFLEHKENADQMLERIYEKHRAETLLLASVGNVPELLSDEQKAIQRISESGLFDAEYYAAAYEIKFETDRAALEHFFFHGYKEGKRPNLYFDPLWYLEKNPDVLAAGVHPLFHYLVGGDAENRQPSLIFDNAWYRAEYGVPDSKNTLAHYLAHRTSYRFSPLPEFDVAYYGEVNRDVRMAGVDPFQQFLQGGFREGRNPSLKFNVDYYAKRYLRGELKSNPLLHFLEHKHEPGVRGAPALDDESASQAPLKQLELQGKELAQKTLTSKTDSGLVQVTTTFPIQPAVSKHVSSPATGLKEAVGLIEKSGLFDRDWYLQRYPEVAELNVDPILHYLKIGASKLANPGPDFDTQYYLNRYADVKKVGTNPLLHFLRAGRAEGRHPNAAWGNFALVIHAFHLDVLDDLAEHVAYFPLDADQYVSFPESFSVEQQAVIRDYFPKAQPIAVKNVGQDVGALFQLMDRVDFKKYGFICKIHSKKGQKFPVEWRRSLLRGVLGSAARVQNIVKAFRSNPAVSLAGPRQLFLYGPNNLYRNAENIKTYFGGIAGDQDLDKFDWGFFGGTCFWSRTSILISVCERLKQLNIEAAAYTDDGTPAHAAERMFGLLATTRREKVLLNDVINVQAPGAIVSGFPSSLPRGVFTAAARLNVADIRAATRSDGEAVLIEKKVEATAVRGDVNVRVDLPIISGWLAQLGDDNPREAIIKCGEVDLRVMAGSFRRDLQENGINKGKHAFSVTVPSKVMDGNSRDVLLIDAITGKEISRKTNLWNRPKRPYIDFDGFLKASMTSPVVEAPFVEEDKRCFAVMENIANDFVRRALALTECPLVSVIMPVYNREAFVAHAITSVLGQNYPNFELIVIDDGSRDSSVSVIESFSDPRIKPIFLPRNEGHSAARNAGLKAARGSIIAYLDSDNSWDSRYISATVGAYDALSAADAIYSGQLLYRGVNKEPFAVRYGHFNAALLQNQNYIDLNSFSHRHKLLKRTIGFDSSLRRFVDYDLIMRSSEQGKMFSVPLLLCNYCLDKADNTVTNDHKNFGDLKIVRDRLADRTAKRLKKLDAAKLKRPVTVVIPNWQSLEDIRDCLAAFTARDWRGMLDIIVADNASDPDVVAFLRSEAEAGHIQLIENKRNFGFTYAVNQGIAAARPDSDIFLLNNDAIVQPGAISVLQEACYKLSDAGMTVPRQILPAGTNTLQTHVPYASDQNDCDVNISAHHRNIGATPLFHDGGVLELTYAPFFAIYIRRDVIDRIGPLDAEYGRHYRSDRVYCDFMRSMTQRRMYYVPDAFVIHKLQKATERLRDTSKESEDFDLMFKRNQWDQATAAELHFRSAPWDL